MRQVKVKGSTLSKVVRFHVLEAASSLIDNHFSDRKEELGHVIDGTLRGYLIRVFLAAISGEISGQYALRWAHMS